VHNLDLVTDKEYSNLKQWLD